MKYVLKLYLRKKKAYIAKKKNPNTFNVIKADLKCTGKITGKENMKKALGFFFFFYTYSSSRPCKI